jgi:4-hydroxythreonine-4-phosphate dehydrogenase
MIAFTCGDPAGVGPEIIQRWLVEHPEEAGNVAVIGPAIWISRLPDAVRKIAVGIEAFEAIPGKPSGEGALVAWAAMERAAFGCKEGVRGGGHWSGEQGMALADWLPIPRANRIFCRAMGR